jgi:hypothetical protein
MMEMAPDPRLKGVFHQINAYSQTDTVIQLKFKFSWTVRIPKGLQMICFMKIMMADRSCDFICHVPFRQEVSFQPSERFRRDGIRNSNMLIRSLPDVRLQPAIHFPEHMQNVLAGSIGVAFVWQGYKSDRAAQAFDGAVKALTLNRKSS